MFADKRQPAFASPNMHVTGTAVHDGRCRCTWRTLRYQQTTHAFNISFSFFALQGNWKLNDFSTDLLQEKTRRLLSIVIVIVIFYHHFLNYSE